MVKATTQKATVTGLIIPFNWDTDGSPYDLKLSAVNEQEYLLVRNNKQKELRNFARRRASIKGEIFEAEGSEKSLLVEEYIIFND